MDEKQLQFLYSEYAKNKGFKDYSEFKGLMSSEESRKLFFDDANTELGFKDYNEFNDLLGLKKKAGGEVSSLSKSQLVLPDFEKGKAFAEKGFLMKPEGTKEEIIETPDNQQGLLLNIVSSLDKGFAKNFISSPIKGLGTILQGTTKKVLGGTGEGYISDKLIKLGDYLNNAIDEVTPQDEEFKNTLWDQAGQAVGQIGSLVLTGGLTGAAGKGAALVSQAPKGAAITAVKTLGSQLSSPTAISAGLSMGQAEFDRAIQAGATDDQAFEAFYKNAVTGSVLETVPVMQFFKRFNKSTAGSVANYIKTKGVAGLTGGIEEMTTEIMQQIYANKTAKDIYNINQDILDGVGTSGGIGFGVGFLLNAMGANAKILRKQGKLQEADVLDNQVKQYEDNLENPKVTSGNKVSAKDIVTQGAEIGTKKAIQSLDRDLGNNVITPEQYEEGIVFTEKAAQVVDKIPEIVTGESRVKSVELLVERNDIKQANEILIQQKQITDEAYHAGIDEEIKANEEKIKKVDAEVYNIVKKPSKDFGDKKYIVDGEEVSQAEFEALQGKPTGTKEIIKAEVKPEEVKVTEEIKPTENITSKEKNEKFDTPTLKSPASNYEKLYVPRNVVEEAYKNDKPNNPIFGIGNQSLNTIIQRGGYSIEELDNLLPNWKEIASGEEVKPEEVKPEEVNPEEVKVPTERGKVEGYFSLPVDGKIYKLFNEKEERPYSIKNVNGEYIVDEVLGNQQEVYKRKERLVKPLFDEENIPNPEDKMFIIEPAKLSKNADGTYDIIKKGKVYYGSEAPKEIITEKIKPTEEKTKASSLPSPLQDIEGLKGEQPNIRTEATRKIVNAVRYLEGLEPYTGPLDKLTNVLTDTDEYHSFTIGSKLNNLEKAVEAVKNLPSYKGFMSEQAKAAESKPIAVKEEVKPTEAKPIKKEAPKKTYQEALKEKQAAEKKQTRQTAGEKAAATRKTIEESNKIEASDARSAALKYLTGGKLSWDAINEVAGRVKRATLNTGAREFKSEEARSRDYVAKKGEGQSLDEAADSIWNDLSEEIQNKMDTQDVKNALMMAVSEYNSKAEMAQALIDGYKEESIEELENKYYERFGDNAEIEIDKELNQVPKNQLDIEQELINANYESEQQFQDDYWNTKEATNDFTEKAPSTKAQKAETAKGLAEAYKDLTINQKRQIINSKFDELLKELKIEKICPT